MFSYEGIGEMVVSVGMTEEVNSGEVVRMMSSDMVCPCEDGELFCGVALKADKICGSMQLKGFVTVPYSGEGMDVGWMKLAANGMGGVRVDANGKPMLVIRKDEDAMTIVVCL